MFFITYLCLLSIAYELPTVVFAICFTCAPTSPISSAFLNLPISASTTPIEIEVSGNCSIIPRLFATSTYPLKASSFVKYSNTFSSNSLITFLHICS